MYDLSAIVDMDAPSCNARLALVALKVLVRLLVVLTELAHDVLADVSALALLDLSETRDLELVLGMGGGPSWQFRRAGISGLRGVAAGDGNVLDGAADNVTFHAGDVMCDTVSR